MIAIAVSIIMAGTGIATAWAEKVIGGAAVGAMAEKPELFGKGLTMMVLPETIVIFGFAMAFLLMGHM
jgi:V/A-type H+-transporting ATPase subunit K